LNQCATVPEALAFVREHGVVLASARGAAPRLTEAIAGEPIKGSWWGHPMGQQIFRLCESLDDSDDVLTFKLVEGKLTLVHRRLWPALVRLASRFEKAKLARVWNEHTASGAHRARRMAFPSWVPADVKRAARALSVADAEAILGPVLPAAADK
jgi:hypothetical protein